MKTMKTFYALILGCYTGNHNILFWRIRNPGFSRILRNKFPEIRISGPEGNIISIVAEDD